MSSSRLQSSNDSIDTENHSVAGGQAVEGYLDLLKRSLYNLIDGDTERILGIFRGRLQIDFESIAALTAAVLAERPVHDAAAESLVPPAWLYPPRETRENKQWIERTADGDGDARDATIDALHRQITDLKDWLRRQGIGAD